MNTLDPEHPLTRYSEPRHSAYCSLDRIIDPGPDQLSRLKYKSAGPPNSRPRLGSLQSGGGFISTDVP